MKQSKIEIYCSYACKYAGPSSQHKACLTENSIYCNKINSVVSKSALCKYNLIKYGKGRDSNKK